MLSTYFAILCNARTQGRLYQLRVSINIGTKTFSTQFSYVCPTSLLSLEVQVWEKGERAVVLDFAFYTKFLRQVFFKRIACKFQGNDLPLELLLRKNIFLYTVRRLRVCTHFLPFLENIPHTLEFISECTGVNFYYFYEI